MKNFDFPQSIQTAARLEPENVPIISLWEPWASWVMLGWKTIETRTHDRFACLRGKTIGIHAAKHFDRLWFTAAANLLTDQQFRYTRDNIRWNKGGKLLGVVDVVDAIWLNAEHSRGALIDCSSISRFGLILSNPRRLENEIDMMGKQGIWYSAIIKQVEKERQ